jgi:hypothetical protein
VFPPQAISVGAAQVHAEQLSTNNTLFIYFTQRSAPNTMHAVDESWIGQPITDSNDIWWQHHLKLTALS